MKLLIIAGPYEADRIRRAAVSAGFEAVAVEPGDSLSGWITATRPDVIILAPQIVNGDPDLALAKVRAVPRGRVPIFLVGDPEDQARFETLGEGFFVRPVAADELLARAREAVARAIPRAGDDSGSGPHGSAGLGADDSGRVGTPVGTSAAKTGGSGRTTTLRPLVAAREPEGPPVVAGTRLPPPTRRATATSAATVEVLDVLAETIDADFDADIRDAVRDVGALRQRQTVATPASSSVPSSGKSADDAAASSSPADEIDLDLPSLLARMYLSRLSGRLTLKHGAARTHIVFERGHPVLAGSTRVEDRMGEMLIRQGRFTSQQIAACGEEVAASGRRMGAVLVDRGLVKATELSGLVRRHYEDVIYSLFTWERGAWNLGTDASAAAEKVLLSRHPAALILEGIRRKFSAPRALAGLGGADRVLRLRLTTGASDLLEKMEITPEERNLVLLFDGVRSLDEIHGLTGAPAERLYGVAWALTVLERLDVVEGVGRTPSAASPGGAGGGGGAGAGRTRGDRDETRDEAIDRALVQSRHALVVEGDYFQILGVSRDASAQEIQRAHEVLVSELAPESLHPSVAAEWDAELTEIRDVLDEAVRLLGDERLRRQYREHLTGGWPAAEERAP
ncbi:MAG: DUF4388 domain-containing protein [Pseudomonadota bacterium]